uniref:Dendrocyte expressed seven transmembrane protein n=1 Tax=Acanthochromis polyacanthus TaxID=80966 RepID=A0A3Q1GLQ0_9TELE
MQLLHDDSCTFFHLIVCLFVSIFFSLLLSSLLLLYLLFTLDYELAVAGGMAGCFGTILTVALFASKRIRCLGTLFVISVFMKKSRNLLLTAGTSIVVLKNIRNTLENLTRLVRSMICNLQAKKAAITAPFSNYVEMLKWIGNMLKGVTDLGVVNLDSHLKVSPRLESEKFSWKLADAEQKLNETVKYAKALMNTVSAVVDRMFPAISFLVFLLFIALHVKKYCNDMKYKNRFISSKFVRFDEKQKAEGKPHVLPLTPQEVKLYTSIYSIRPTGREGKAMLKFGIPVASHFVAWVIFITVDALLYLFSVCFTFLRHCLPLIHSNFQGIATLIGIQFGEENHQEDFSYSVTLFEKKCLPKPELLLYNSVFPLTAILLTLLIMALMAAKVSRLRLMVCERFFATAAEARVEYLHGTILRKRLKLKKEKNTCSFMTLLVKPHFWCPLLFPPKGNQQIMV